MPWNEPGGNGRNNNPWGGNKDQGPPALDKILNDFIKKLRAMLSGKKNTGSSWQPSNNQSLGFLAAVIGGAILILWFLSGLFIVNPAEEAVILRLGKYSDVVQPGLHWFARFIDTKYVLDVRKIYSFSLQGDFLTKSSEQKDMPIQVESTKKQPYTSLDQSKNLVNVELNVQYRIRDPRNYLFSVVDPDSTIKEVASGALSDIVGQMKLDDVLTTGRENLSSGVLERIRKVIAPYNAGIEVVAVTLRKVQAPDQVREAFSDVNRADQDKATYIQQAQAYASKVVPIAQGMAARTLADANGYQQQAVLIAQANIAKYQALVKVYATAPEVTRQRMYLETMQKVLQNTSKVLVDSNVGNNLIYLPLDKLMNRDIQKVSANDDAAPSPSPGLASATENQNEVTINQPSTPEVRNDSN
jgi:membrane protease subunit HflK